MSFLERFQKMEKSGGNFWHYEKPGDFIAGEAVSDLRTINTKFGDRLAIDILSEADGLVYTVIATTVIANELTKQRVEKGKQVGIKYLGMKKNYKDFVVHVEKVKREAVKNSPWDGEENRDPDFEREDNLGEPG